MSKRTRLTRHHRVRLILQRHARSNYKPQVVKDSHGQKYQVCYRLPTVRL